MANSNAPFGLIPIRSLGAANLVVNEYEHDSGDGTALFIGDPVKSTGDSTSAVAGIPDGTPQVIATGTITTTAMRGVVQQVRATLTNFTLQYGAASTSYGLLVADDPGQIFRIQSNGLLVHGDISATCGLTSGSGSTTTGTSAYVLTESDIGQSSHVLHVIRLSPITGNALGNYGIVDVRVNVHELGQGTGAAGT